MGIVWVNGVIEAVNPEAGVVARILADNGKTYRLRSNGFAPEDRTPPRLGDRVRFEDRLGYVLDLRVTQTVGGNYAQISGIGSVKADRP